MWRGRPRSRRGQVARPGLTGLLPPPAQAWSPRPDPSPAESSVPYQLGECPAASPREHRPLSHLPAASGACQHLAQLENAVDTRRRAPGSPRRSWRSSGQAPNSMGDTGPGTVTPGGKCPAPAGPSPCRPGTPPWHTSAVRAGGGGDRPRRRAGGGDRGPPLLSQAPERDGRVSRPLALEAWSLTPSCAWGEPTASRQPSDSLSSLAKNTNQCWGCMGGQWFWNSQGEGGRDPPVRVSERFPRSKGELITSPI